MAVRNMGRAERRSEGHGLRVSLALLVACVWMLSLPSHAAMEGMTREDARTGAFEGQRSAFRETPREQGTSAPVATIKLQQAEMKTAGVGKFPHRPAYSGPEGREFVRRLVAVPAGAAPEIASVRLVTADEVIGLDAAQIGRVASVEFLGLIREQRVALVRVDGAALMRAAGSLDLVSVELDLAVGDAEGPLSVPTGPMSRVCAGAVANYEPQPADVTTRLKAGSTRGGTVTYCSSAADCAAAGIDELFLTADQLASAPMLFAYASHHASYFGLNIGIVSVSDLPTKTADSIHQFIQDVYETSSAEHFGDGRLGAVMLVGDVYADDNSTIMMPAYYGYGGTESASDHYYACVSGDDDFEDVLLGRLSVGNLQELVAVLSKSVAYQPPSPEEPWRKRVLLIGGLFYKLKEEYVELFDEYDAIIPDEVIADRLYRHDYGTDQSCALDVADAINDGYLFVNFNGDGWISVWEHVLNTGHLELLNNLQRLPIVLSMACMTGWLDNVSQPDLNGSYDCLAEQLVNAPDGGAVACVAAPRSSDGGIFKGFTQEIYRAAFEEHCTFTGEMLATAKLLHLRDEGSLTYTRQFALFGDPLLMFGSNVGSDDAPDLVLKPHETIWSPETASTATDLTISVGVSNESAVGAQDITVRLIDTSTGGTYEHETTLPSLGPWATETTSFVVQTPTVGPHAISVEVDPYGTTTELHEDNNSFERDIYVYPLIDGFPIEVPAETHSPCVVSLQEVGRRLLIPDGDARVWSLDASGEVDWTSQATWGASSYGREIAVAVGDLDRDGVFEIVTTKFLGLVALRPDGTEIWTANTGDPLGHPLLADADADGDLDVIACTRPYFGGTSAVVAIDENGATIWSHPLDADVDVTTTPVAGDFDLDGVVDVAFGTSDGTIQTITCEADPPQNRWGVVTTGLGGVTTLGLADIDSDGLLEIISAADRVRSFNAEDGSDDGWDIDLGSHVTCLAVGDVDEDGDVEIFAGSVEGRVGLIDSGTLAWTLDIGSRPGSSAAIADVDGNPGMEIVFGTDDGFVHVLSASGDDIVSPMPLPGACMTPFVSDLTNDGTMDVAVCTDNGHVYAFDLGAHEGESESPEWLGLGGTASRASILEQPFWGTFDGNLVMCGNFHIVDDVIISAGSTLTIAADARIAFNGSGLEIAGTLHAPGVRGSEITMTRSPASRENWSGIEVRPGASVYMSSCVVTDAVVGLQAMSAAITLVDCEFARNDTGAVMENCALHATRTSFSESNDSGLRVEDGAGTVADCVFGDNRSAGLVCTEASSYRFVRSVFSGSLEGNGAEFMNSSHCVVDSCSFSSNAFDGAKIKQSSPRFTHCDFNQNAQYGLNCEKLSLPSLNWCSVIGNKMGVVCRTGAYPNLGNTLDPNSGHNSIYSNHQAAVANYTLQGTPIQARRNWWGSAPPAGRLFVGYVAYTPWLEQAPDPTLYASAAPEFDAVYGLGQNHPNPFNPVTTLTFSVPPAAGDVLLTVHDIAGRLIRTLHNGPATPGSHEIVWDGRDDLGNRVASGVYFARMVAPDFGATRKMLLLK